MSVANQRSVSSKRLSGRPTADTPVVPSSPRHMKVTNDFPAWSGTGSSKGVCSFSNAAQNLDNAEVSPPTICFFSSVMRGLVSADRATVCFEATSLGCAATALSKALSRPIKTRRLEVCMGKNFVFAGVSLISMNCLLLDRRCCLDHQHCVLPGLRTGERVRLACSKTTDQLLLAAGRINPFRRGQLCRSDLRHVQGDAGLAGK